MPTADQVSPTTVVDSDHPSIIEFTMAHTDAKASDTQNVISLYYEIRDSIRYDTYNINIEPKGFSASNTLSNAYGWCVTKAVLLTACCRAAGIPARLGFADVRNHLTSEKLRKEMNTDVFMWHGYADIYLQGKWVKATPAFNLSLCEKANIHPLEFDGTEDSIYHEFDKAGNKHMEYVRHHGVFDDLPYQQIVATFEEHYAKALFANTESDFEEDVASEHIADR